MKPMIQMSSERQYMILSLIWHYEANMGGRDEDPPMKER